MSGLSRGVEFYGFVLYYVLGVLYTIEVMSGIGCESFEILMKLYVVVPLVFMHSEYTTPKRHVAGASQGYSLCFLYSCLMLMRASMVVDIVSPLITWKYKKDASRVAIEDGEVGEYPEDY